MSSSECVWPQPVLNHLQVSSEKVGLYGRRVVTFELATRRRGASAQLPSNSITSGDIVGVFARGQKLAETVLSGVVTQSNDSAVEVAFDDIPDSAHLSSHDGWLQLVRLANDVTYRRIRKSLEELQSYCSGPAHHLVGVMFAEAPPGDPDARYAQLLQLSEGEGEEEHTASPHLQFLNPALDPSQRRAVLLALGRPDVTIIHGPPGTGKTTTTVEVIVQAVGRGEKVLACAPSNTAVDNLVERLARTGTKVVRLGHPARLVGSVMQHSLDALLLARDSAQIIQDVRRDIQYAMGQSSLAGNRGDRARWKGEVRSLRKELQRREQVRGSVILCVYRRLEIFVFNNFRRYPTTTKINNTDFFQHQTLTNNFTLLVCRIDKNKITQKINRPIFL